MSKIDAIFHKAQKTVEENEKIKRLTKDVSVKLKRISSDKDQIGKLAEYVQLLIRMIRYHLSGRYRSFSMRTILMFVFALVYFLTPMDVIPDFIPILGFTDDISIIYYIFKNVADDIAEFQNWEADTV